MGTNRRWTEKRKSQTPSQVNPPFTYTYSTRATGTPRCLEVWTGQDRRSLLQHVSHVYIKQASPPKPGPSPRFLDTLHNCPPTIRVAFFHPFPHHNTKAYLV